MSQIKYIFWVGMLMAGLNGCQKQGSIRVATFNVSMESTNYGEADPHRLEKELQSGENVQIKHIAETIQRVRPDIILLTEFDVIDDAKKGVEAFMSSYLSISQNTQRPIDYPYFYYSDVNTGHLFPVDLNGDGDISLPDDAYGWGKYPGQYGMLLLSKYPIKEGGVRSFKDFLWKDMPDALLPKKENGDDYYSPEQLSYFRLSSKSHWDVPIDINGNTLHVLASHPTPPVFDGPEDRNGKRNFDELRLWKDYLNGEFYLHEFLLKVDSGQSLKEQKRFIADDARFVVMGDLNASDIGGEGVPGAVDQLLNHPLINDPRPTSTGAERLWQSNKEKYRSTHEMGLRLDYVLPSRNLSVVASEVYWPTDDSDLHHLVAKRELSSDHRLVWVDIEI